MFPSSCRLLFTGLLLSLRISLSTTADSWVGTIVTDCAEIDLDRSRIVPRCSQLRVYIQNTWSSNCNEEESDPRKSVVKSDQPTYVHGVPSGHFWQEFPVYTESYEDVDDDKNPHASSTPAPEPQPHFLDGISTNVTAQLGGKVTLNCRVGQLGDKTISWVRRRGEELVILSAGRFTLASDGRWTLQAIPSGDWRLVLNPVAARDQGIYECQVSTHPPIVRQIRLTVLVPKVEIVDERGVSVSDKFYKEGSIIELRCVISRVPQPSGQVVWTHAGRHLNFDTKRGGISVKTEVQNSGALSRLYIANAARRDSGNYTCALEDVSATTVAVHVLRGENPLAMQRGGGMTTLPQSYIALLLLLPTS